MYAPLCVSHFIYLWRERERETQSEVMLSCASIPGDARGSFFFLLGDV